MRLRMGYPSRPVSAASTLLSSPVRMARHTGPKGKIARRLGFAPAGIPKTQKIINRRRNRPGDQGVEKQGKQTEYAKLLLEKQRMRHSYALLERQFRNLFAKAKRAKGLTGENLFRLLESRLDTVVFRMHIAPSILASRQLVRHGHIIVNGRRTDLPSYQLKPGDVVEVREKSRNLPLVRDTLEGRHPNAFTVRVDYVSFDGAAMKGSLIRLPDRNEIPVELNEQLVVEYYSR